MNKGKWQELTWGQIATLEYGKPLRGYKHNIGRVPVYGTNGLIGYTDVALCDTDGVIIGRKGAYRGVHYSSKPFYVIDTAFYLNAKDIGPLDNRWAYYSLLNTDINSLDSGSAIPSTSRSDFYALPVHLPPYIEQKAIADTLSCLDDKIELNNRINKTLEEMAQAIFKSWFVDFEPFQDGEFEDSELGPIPKGWRVLELGEIITFEKGKKPQLLFDAKESHCQDKYITINVLNNGQPQYACKDKMILVDELDIIMVMDGASSGSVFFGHSGIVGSTMAKVKVKTEQLKEVIYHYLKSVESEISLHNTGSAIPHADKSFVLGLKIAVPPERELDEIAITFSNIRSLIIKNQVQSRVLAKIRDTLLPKLMSGEVRVPIEEV